MEEAKLVMGFEELKASFKREVENWQENARGWEARFRQEEKRNNRLESELSGMKKKLKELEVNGASASVWKEVSFDLIDRIAERGAEWRTQATKDR